VSPPLRVLTGKGESKRNFEPVPTLFDSDPAAAIAMGLISAFAAAAQIDFLAFFDSESQRMTLTPLVG